MKNAILTVHFMDGTKLSVRYPRMTGLDASTIAAAVKRALDAEKIAVEIDGDLLVIPMRNVKYFHITPAPDHMPQGVIRGGRLMS
jgi:hypothetical protein